MPLIKGRPLEQKATAHLRAVVTKENHLTWQLYKEFISEDSDYLLNQLIEQHLAKDKDFVEWRKTHSTPVLATPSADRDQVISAPETAQEPAPLRAEKRV